ncbi:MAG: adenine phosphoribosyltransferase [Elusimicrobia bacterium CG08_land_8_20_14_0_20_51_18]|nr:MAG: adenine phosphoribosyltransferase [Elusimicrobia bacterium CG08_land_8_20_14_0_20_51_18]
MTERVKKIIRDVPDFPKPGILFKDIMPLLADHKTMSGLMDFFAEKYANRGITKVLGIEARGFILAAPLALKIGAGIIPVRKKGKLPYRTVSVTYDLEYGQDTLQIHEDAIQKGEKVLIVDDVLATGGTARAVCQLVDKLGGSVEEVAMLIELEFLKGRKKLDGYNVFSFIKY